MACIYCNMSKVGFIYAKTGVYDKIVVEIVNLIL